MRILVDTNILISAILLPKSVVAKALLHITENHNMVLCDQNIAELRDAKDQPILNAAIISNVDIILTGDKDFLSLDMEHPRCMNVSEFMKSEKIEI